MKKLILILAFISFSFYSIADNDVPNKLEKVENKLITLIELKPEIPLAADFLDQVKIDTLNPVVPMKATFEDGPIRWIN